MIDSLIKNLEQEARILRELRLYNKMEPRSDSEEKLISAVKISLENRFRIINSSIPDILEEIAPSKKIVISPEGKKSLEKVNLLSVSSAHGTTITLKKGDREKFLKESRIDSSALKQLKNKAVVLKEENVEFRGSRGYVKISNRFFLETAQKLIKQGNFADLKSDLSKANIDILFSSYVAMMLFSTFIAIFAGIIISTLLLFFKIGIMFPFLTPYAGSIISRMLQTSWLVIAIPVGTFFALYYYPSSEKNSIEKSIEQELPFAVIHMSAVSGSGIEPTEIFKIIGRSMEYPSLRKEIRKVLNQINLYGYDLITALNNVAKNTPSAKLSELFSGLSTTMTSGGDLSDFLQKRSETLLIGYRLEREKFTKVAETFMDIYISLVIAAPMILMLLLVMIQISNINIGFSTLQLSLLIIGAIAILNIFFLAFLHMKQPKY
jgi:pilus assembly protein TadC